MQQKTIEKTKIITTLCETRQLVEEEKEVEVHYFVLSENDKQLLQNFFVLTESDIEFLEECKCYIRTEVKRRKFYVIAHCEECLQDAINHVESGLIQKHVMNNIKKFKIKL